MPVEYPYFPDTDKFSSSASQSEFVPLSITPEHLVGMRGGTAAPLESTSDERKLKRRLKVHTQGYISELALRDVKGVKRKAKEEVKPTGDIVLDTHW